MSYIKQAVSLSRAVTASMAETKKRETSFLISFSFCLWLVLPPKDETVKSMDIHISLKSCLVISGPKAILPIDGPWRNASLKSFLRNVDAGKEETGKEQIYAKTKEGNIEKDPCKLIIAASDIVPLPQIVSIHFLIHTKSTYHSLP